MQPSCVGDFQVACVSKNNKADKEKKWTIEFSHNFENRFHTRTFFTDIRWTSCPAFKALLRRYLEDQVSCGDKPTTFRTYSASTHLSIIAGKSTRVPNTNIRCTTITLCYSHQSIISKHSHTGTISLHFPSFPFYVLWGHCIDSGHAAQMLEGSHPLCRSRKERRKYISLTHRK